MKKLKRIHKQGLIIITLLMSLLLTLANAPYPAFATISIALASIVFYFKRENLGE